MVAVQMRVQCQVPLPSPGLTFRFATWLSGLETRDHLACAFHELAHILVIKCTIFGLGFADQSRVLPPIDRDNVLDGEFAPRVILLDQGIAGRLFPMPPTGAARTSAP